MTVTVIKNESESGEKLLRRFSGHIKNLKLIQKFRKIRYFKQKPTKRIVRSAAISREKYRKDAERNQFF